jgi:hypothetical protein
MTDNKKAAGVGEPQAASQSFQASHSNPIHYRLKATVYRLAPWLIFIGVLHG